ncbi:MAG: FAD-dependent monooxygenase [Alphaproteobacteria bacterium]
MPVYPAAGACDVGDVCEIEKSVTAEDLDTREAEVAGSSQQVDVVIVGAGPVGLALATELAMRGHTACIVEKNERIGLQPRAKTTNVRTMTHMRRWGLAPTMRERSPLAPDFPRRVRFATALFGKELYSFDNAFCASPARDPRYPEHAEFIPQYVVEGILFDHVMAEPRVEVLLQHELTDFTATEADGVAAAVKDLRDGSTRTITGRFLVGADGGRSTVRRGLGIAMAGERSLLSCVTLILRMPGLKDDPTLHHALFHWLVSPEAPCVMGPMDRDDRWYWMKTIPPGTEPSDGELLELIRKAMRKDYPIEILARDYWTVHKLIADAYRRGNVFLAGDACHLHSPFGGHGMNLGVADAVDLGWKISAVLDGWAGEALLDSYETERKPVHRQVIETATENVAALSEYFLAPALEDETAEGQAQRGRTAEAIAAIKEPEFRSLGIVLGYRYRSPHILAEEAGDPPPFSITTYRPESYPGCLAPHAWLAGGGSLYDHFGDGFTFLVSGKEVDDEEGSFLKAAAEAGMPLTCLALDALDEETLGKLYPRRYTLIRPDQHVAWRGDVLPAFEALFDTVVRGRKAAAENKMGTIRA